MNPLWFDYKDVKIRLNGGENRAWLKHAKKDKGRITILFMDPRNMWRYAQVQGRIVERLPRERANTSTSYRGATSGAITRVRRRTGFSSKLFRSG
jgi:hypothetical protein